MGDELLATDRDEIVGDTPEVVSDKPGDHAAIRGGHLGGSAWHGLRVGQGIEDFDRNAEFPGCGLLSTEDARSNFFVARTKEFSGCRGLAGRNNEPGTISWQFAASQPALAAVEDSAEFGAQVPTDWGAGVFVAGEALSGEAELVGELRLAQPQVFADLAEAEADGFFLGR